MDDSLRLIPAADATAGSYGGENKKMDHLFDFYDESFIDKLPTRYVTVCHSNAPSATKTSILKETIFTSANRSDRLSKSLYTTNGVTCGRSK